MSAILPGGKPVPAARLSAAVPRGSDAEMFAMSSLFNVSGSQSRSQLAIAHRQKLGVAPQWREQRLVGAGQPCLAVEPQQRIEQCRTPARIEMCGNFVEQQQWRLAAHRLLQPRMSEDDRNKQRLLLAGRGQFGGNALLGQTDIQVGAT